MTSRLSALPIPALLALALSAALPVQAEQGPVSIRVDGEAPAALIEFSYTGPVADRALPFAVVDTMGDLGTVRVPLTLDGRGRYVGSTFLNRNGSYAAFFEGEDLIEGRKLLDDNDRKLYGFEVISSEEQSRREREARKEALRVLRIERPALRRASSVFFRSRQPERGRDAIVRSEDGRSVYLVRIDPEARNRVRILERVR